jgi:hypothetical protein
MIVVVVVVFYFSFQFYMQLIFDHIQPDLFDIVFDNDVLSKKEFEKKNISFNSTYILITLTPHFT